MYATRKEAEEKTLEALRYRGVVALPYLCDTCGMWHIGKSRRHATDERYMMDPVQAEKWKRRTRSYRKWMKQTKRSYRKQKGYE